jgi:hypothetical protein
MSKFFTAFCVLALVSALCWAQAPTGTITGLVTDESGAVIPNAKITVTNRDTGTGRELTTSAAGRYSVEALASGVYMVRVEATGFSTRERGATVEAGTSTRVDMLMKVGAQGTVVTVGDVAPQIETESHNVSGVVTRTKIQDLPLNGRSFLNLASIEPGVSVGVGSTAQYNAQFSVSMMGQSGGRTSYTVDGGNIRDTIENTGPAQNFSQEVVQEFQVSSVNFDLSTGITAVGAVNIVTRSGGNQFHGSAYFFFRDHNMAAYPGLQRSAVNPDPFFARRNPGFWLSGPIKKDKAFFFFNYEYQNQASAVTFQPTNLASLSTLGGNFLAPYKGKTLTGKFDYRFSDKHSVIARYSHDGNNSVGPRGGQELPSHWLVNSNWSDLTTFGVTSSLRPTLVNEFRFNYQYWHNRNLFPTSSSCPGCLGLEGIAPEIGINGSNVTIGHTANATQGRDLRQFQFNDQIAWIKGNHRFRFGMDFQYAPGTGFWGFCDPFCTSVAPPELVRSNVPAALVPALFPTLPSAVRNYNDILNLPFLGAVIGVGDPSQPPPYNVDQAKTNNHWRLFAQDTWHIRPNFSLNYGVAWSWESKLFNFDLSKPAYLAPLYGSDLTPTNNNNKNFSPSVGFAWSPRNNTKTVIRAGFGVYYDTAQLYQRLQERAYTGPIGNGRVQYPSSGFKNIFPGIVNISTGGTPVAVGAAVPSGALINMTLGQFIQIYQAQIGGIAAALAPKNLNDLTIRNIDISKSGAEMYSKNYPMMHGLHFNLGIQRQITKDMALTADLVRRVFLNVDLGPFDFNRYQRFINGVQTPVIPRCSAAQSSTPGVNCSNGAITFWNPGGRTVYNGLLVKLDKRFSSRYQFTASYTLSQQHGYTTLYNQDKWSNSWVSQGGRHNLNFVSTIDIPAPSGAGWFWLRDFQLGVITAIGSKGPGNVTVGSADLTGSGVTTTPLPGLPLACINRGCSSGDIVAAVNSWNTTYAGKKDARGTTLAALKIPTNFFFGRNFFSQDLRLTKNIKFRSERYKLSLFGEVFNLFNYANLGGQSTGLDAATSANSAFGVPTQRSGQTFGSGGPRAFQIGSRFTF